MLLNILDLEKVTVEDIMVPRNEVVGIDLEDAWEEILEHLVHCQHTRLPVYRDSIDDVVGILHARNVLSLLGTSVLDKEQLIGLVREPYYVPEGTALHRQLLNFQRSRRRIGLVVDEYGDIQGLVTLEDILEEIIGEFTTDVSALSRDTHPQDDGSLLVDAGVTIRELNRLEGLDLPTDGPKTLNGLVLEYLENIPEAGTSLKLAGYPIEIVQTTGNAVKTVRIQPRLDD
jgi:Mg2+/Co2+ transporter CorB